MFEIPLLISEFIYRFFAFLVGKLSKVLSPGKRESSNVLFKRSSKVRAKGGCLSFNEKMLWWFLQLGLERVSYIKVLFFSQTFLTGNCS